jgi:membrane protease YdiL (CAAX protease family)
VQPDGPTPPLADTPPFLSETPPEPGRPWGFWATLAWASVIIVAYLITEGVAYAVFLAIQKNSPFIIENDGKFLAFSTTVGAPVIIGLCLLFASLRKNISVREYLGLSWPPPAVARRWLIILLLVGLISDSLTALVGKPIVPPFMTDAYQSAADWLPLLWVALMIAAPLGEEFFFRGFLFSGLQHSFVRPIGAILITATLWAAIHVQYDWSGVLTIFAGGLVQGVARWKTNSLLICIAMHSLMNLVATIETIVQLNILAR